MVVDATGEGFMAVDNKLDIQASGKGMGLGDSPEVQPESWALHFRRSAIWLTAVFTVMEIAFCVKVG